MFTPLIKSESLLEWKYIPFMSLWVSFKKGGTKIFYSRELQNSLKQISNRDILPDIDFHFGFQGLIYLAEETLKDQFNKAIIYGIKNENRDSGQIIREYFPDGSFKAYQEPDFNSESWKLAKDKLVFKILENCRRCEKITSVFDPQNPIIIKRYGQNRI